MKTSPAIIRTDPREYFGYPACIRCREKPCENFGWSRYGRRLVFAHNSRYDTSFPCPFAASSFSEVEQLIRDLTIQEINWHIQTLLAKMTLAEGMQYDQQHYLTSWGDFGERTAYLRVLWEARIFSLLRSPLSCDWDEKMKAWFAAWEAAAGRREEEKKEEEKKEEPEEPPAQSQKEAAISTAAWEHTDDERKKASPKAVSVGDVVGLTVSTRNIPDNETVTFTVYNVAGTSARALATIGAQVSGNRAEATWTVEKDKKQDVTELEWDAEYQGVRSERGKIEWAVADLKITLDIDPNDPEAQNDIFTLYSSEDEPKYKQMKTVKDDVDTTNDTMDLIFTDVDTSLMYTLEVDYGGNGAKEVIFENRSYGNWI